MQDSLSDSTHPPAYHCPSCGHLVTAPPDHHNLLQCPNCGEQFFLADSSEPEAIDEPLSAADPEAEISELRIRDMMYTRQRMYRPRRWPIIWAAAGVVVAAKLIQMTAVALRHEQRVSPALDLLGAILALAISVHFTREAIRITRQIRSTRQPEPTAPPDFSTLSDGSQHWKNLQKLTDTET